MTEDYYKTLGIEKSADQEEVKKAYRNLAHQFHPDKSGGNESKFKEINEAHEVLSDKAKRAKYDKYGENWQHAEAFEKAGAEVLMAPGLPDLAAVRAVIGEGEKVTYDIKRSRFGSTDGAVGTQAYADALIRAMG